MSRGYQQAPTTGMRTAGAGRAVNQDKLIAAVVAEVQRMMAAGYPNWSLTINYGNGNAKLVAQQYYEHIQLRSSAAE